MKLSDLPTPCLILDWSKFENNVARFQARAKELGVLLRPHLKTCKSVELARFIHNGQWGPAAVSTLAEVKAFFDDGARNLRFTAPFSAHKLALVAPLMKNGLRFEILLDDPLHAAELAQEAKRLDVNVPIVIEIDNTGYRTGVPPERERFNALVSIIETSAHLGLAGIYSFAGETYTFESLEECADQTEMHRQALVKTASSLRNNGHSCPTVGIGSTPALASAQNLNGLTESCAGVFVFQDMFQCGVGVCDVSEVAVTVLATVVQHKPETGRIYIDAGGLALSHDRSTSHQSLDQGYGLVCDVQSGLPLGSGDIIIKSVSQEHGLVTHRDGGAVEPALLPVGSLVRVMPNHVCMTAAAYEHYEVSDAQSNLATPIGRSNGWSISGQ